ncbi:RES family NAD+ phosphorylase [Olivibacter sitiensis]|uniref:RES family NAD+ phosphorylase n=1 Tax=Olivibacter sitiensis TaxID=376470 RepID=UPI0004133856|nr:RES family NAD+ phosphorylase [Olivibacter sitiensis]
MKAYRLASRSYIADREGIGAKLYGGRWNPPKVPCIYASQFISLALLEKYVHAQGLEQMQDLALLEMEVPDGKASFFEVDLAKLKPSWSLDIDYTQWLGTQLLEDESIVAFSVPSALIPEERNIILNPRAKLFAKVVYRRIVDFATDYRLLAKLRT